MIDIHFVNVLTVEFGDDTTTMIKVKILRIELVLICICACVCLCVFVSHSTGRRKMKNFTQIEKH